MFLLEKLPREEAKATDEPMGDPANTLYNVDSV